MSKEAEMKSIIALLLCAGLAAPGCATSQATRVQTAPQVVVATAPDRAVLADFARQLPAGSRVRAKLTGHRTVRGTLLKTTDRAIILQPRARVAEPLVEVPFDQLESLEQETPNGSGRAVAAGAAAGASAALGTMLILWAILAGAE
jgi:hypothetical protein